jgi:outer membrane lipoprotein-sorting protein
VAAATIGLAPAFAGSGDPDLPSVTAEELITRIAESDVEQLSGTVKITTDLGLPALPGGSTGGGFFGHGSGRGDDTDAGKDEGDDGGSTDDGDATEGSGSTADPSGKLMELAAGSHTLRVTVDGPEKHKMSIIGDATEYSLIHNGDDIWAYDSGSNAAYHATTPEGADRHTPRGDRHELPEELQDASPQQLARQLLKAVDDTTSVTVDGTAKVAGRDAYELLIRPKQTDSTVGSVRIAVDAGKGVPLKVTVVPKSGGSAVLDAGFTSVDFAKPDAGTFEFTPPKGAEVTEKSPSDHETRPETSGFSGLNVIGEGWTSVVRVEGPDGAAGAPGRGAKVPPEARAFLDGFGDPVSGKFGSGTVFSTRLVNALMTDDGALYIGAVDKNALVKAAEAGK